VERHRFPLKKVGPQTSPVCRRCFAGDALMQCESCYRLFGWEEENMTAIEDGTILCEECWEDESLDD